MDSRFSAPRGLLVGASGVLPATWTWGPAGETPGDHYLTGNLVGIEGHFGTATLRVRGVPR